MKLLVVAQTPPPAHGQSLAVAALLQHLRGQPDFEVHHVGLSLSREAAEIGRWQPRKFAATLAAARQARRILRQHGAMPIYYVPAPAKRGALYRDWAIMALVRPRARGLILHWHAVGLGGWLGTNATATERVLTQRLLGRADLAIVQAEAGRDDAAVLQPRCTIVVRNGVPDPRPDFQPRTSVREPCEVLFIGLGCHEKGLFDALEGVRLANAAEPGAYRFTAVGAFASRALEASFRVQCTRQPGAARHAGFVSDEERNRLLASADVLCFPSYYPHEGQPAVILEALAHDLPIITTRWRGIPEGLPDRHVYFVHPRAPNEIAAALRNARRDGPAGGALRRLYLDQFTLARHLAAITDALRSLPQ